MIRQKPVRWSRVSLIAAMLVSQFLFNIPARAQEATQQQNPLVFSVVKTPNIAAIGAMGADSANDVWAVPSVPHPISLRFDGAKWQALPMVDGGRMSGVAVLSSKNVWAVGEQANAAFSEIQHFDGKQWTVVASPHFAAGDALFGIQALSPSNIYAVGASVSKTQKSRPLILHFDGRAWSVVSIPAIANAELLSIAAVSPSDIWAVGGFLKVNHPILALHFNGQQWTRVAVPGGGGLLGVTAIASNNVWAVGSQEGHGALIEHWDGTSWKTFNSPETLITARLNGVSAISATDIWAAGCNQCGDAGLGQAPLVEHFDGSVWTINPAPTSGQGSVGNAVLAIQPGNVFVGGVALTSTGIESVLLSATEVH